MTIAVHAEDSRAQFPLSHPCLASRPTPSTEPANSQGHPCCSQSAPWQAEPPWGGSLSLPRRDLSLDLAVLCDPRQDNKRLCASILLLKNTDHEACPSHK